MSSSIKTFLGAKRFQALFAALRNEEQQKLSPTTFTAVFLSLGICALPALIQFIRIDAGIDTLGITTGIATILAILYRRQLGLDFNKGKDWRGNLSLVHTAFALGCIPTAALLFLAPEWLAPVREEIHAHVPREQDQISLLAAIQFVGIVSVWAAITEEFLYRGLLLSVLRRAPLFQGQNQRDIFAVLTSSALFGLTHLSVWGPGPAIAVTGIGIGFGLGYLATKEKLLPLILYHAIFDALSLSFTLIT